MLCHMTWSDVCPVCRMQAKHHILSMQLERVVIEWIIFVSEQSRHSAAFNERKKGIQMHLSGYEMLLNNCRRCG